ncbi:MAG: hypothetical protein QOG53_78 [Frankiales bacterium]|jgi:hypothetical protein|nr:hypothetical protein [Frankiales bacterium]
MPTGVMDRASDTVARALTWRLGKGTLPVPPEQRMPIFLTAIGAILMPLGIIFVLLGWYGAAHTPYDFEQVPYLISGGLLGVGLCLMGGFLFFGAWIARVAMSTQRSADQLAMLTERLARGGETGLAAVNGESQAPRRRADVSSERFVATASGTMLHRADCPIVASRDNIREVSAKEQEKGKLKPCQICQPLSVG